MLVTHPIKYTPKIVLHYKSNKRAKIALYHSSEYQTGDPRGGAIFYHRLFEQVNLKFEQINTSSQEVLSQLAFQFRKRVLK